MNFEINDTKEGLIKGEQENSQPITSSDYIHGETKKQKGYIFFFTNLRLSKNDVSLIS